jgi:ketosteroid isomerase-like protein
MSQENVETVQAAFAALASDGADGLADYFADDIHYRVIAGAPGVHGPMLEKEAVRAYVQNWSDVFDDFKAAPVEIIDAEENRVVAVFRWGGRGTLSGKEGYQVSAIVFTIRDGKIARAHEYSSPAEALEAAGLSE